MKAVTEEAVRAALRKVKDPDLALSVIDLGLVYGVTVHEGDVRVRMTLTSRRAVPPAARSSMPPRLRWRQWRG